MIKIANNLQRLIHTQTKAALDTPAAPGAPALPEGNFFSEAQKALQMRNRIDQRQNQRMMRDLNQAYDFAVDPVTGIPAYLLRANNFVNDAAQAVSPLAQDFSQNYVNQAQFVNDLGGLGNRALNYVEEKLPEAQGYARSLIDSGKNFVDQVTPAVQAYQDAIKNTGGSLFDRVKNIGSKLYNNPLNTNPPAPPAAPSN